MGRLGQRSTCERRPKLDRPKFPIKHLPTDSRYINQEFGANPQNYARWSILGHDGTDWAVPTGANIYAVLDGVVTKVVYSDSHPLGNYIDISTPDGVFTARYGHNSQLLKTVGDTVRAGGRYRSCWLYRKQHGSALPFENVH